MTKLLIDGRWAGNTGIGKLYAEVMQRMPLGIDTTYIKSERSLGDLFTPFMLGKQIRKTEADLFYSPSFMPPFLSNIPFVFTIHDLMHLFYYSRFHKLYYKWVIAPIAKSAKQIITVSEYSREQLVTLLGIPRERISVIYNGVDVAFHRNEQTFSLEQPYFLYVGNRRKNKNIPSMLRAFSMANISNEFIFAISGDPDEHLTSLIEHLGITHRVKFLGFIEEEALPSLYKGAFATLYVSLMEGFGLPIIESMASGTPVITANTSSLPEIAGDAALCVDPLDAQAIAQAIEQLVSQKTLYQELQQKGDKRSLMFSWDETARRTWDILLS